MAASLASAGDALARSGEALAAPAPRTVETSTTRRIVNGRGVRIIKMYAGRTGRSHNTEAARGARLLVLQKRQIAANGPRSYPFRLNRYRGFDPYRGCAGIAHGWSSDALCCCANVALWH